ncbi:MAG TPA: acetate--CoA ligase, partial [Patescibacteria group bacterium]
MSQADIIRKDPKKFSIPANLVDYNKNYEGFTWEKEAKKSIDFFEDGTLNIAYNCIDRHALGTKKDKVALLFRGAQGEKEEYTFGQLKKLTDKFANVLEGQGVV